MDVDTRLLRYFAAVAEEGNLTRAAERLYVAQPSLTKQIKQLETLLGVRLFVRSRSGMALTEAGRALAGRTPAVLDALAEAVREAKGAAVRAERVLRVGIMGSGANEATPGIIAAFGERRPGWRVEMRQGEWSEPTAGLADGEVDAALLYLPFPGQERWRTAELFTEPRCVLLPAGHRLAARETIGFRELWDEPFVAAPAQAGSWRDWWLATEAREGRAPRIGAETRHPDDWLNAIANGYGIALAPSAAARYYPRPGIVQRPVTGVAPCTVAVVWPPAAEDNAVVREFVAVCREAVAGR
ncbi:LysR family transcriptional regulator [Streptomyces indicus]|uniref:DNA-binding transcriptional regulator, LysR family n=1 Tax=Streptomyces indicus TaxID=417292 RepID=A0A1G8WKI8_9ACTN|nr:LysR family transcriptional regulator [Streptomyces indicus]SDJ78814.1 DNA-binding transcriptional regulator, LysR family [Streptomyces indicus]